MNIAFPIIMITITCLCFAFGYYFFLNKIIISENLRFLSRIFIYINILSAIAYLLTHRADYDIPPIVYDILPLYVGIFFILFVSALIYNILLIPSIFLGSSKEIYISYLGNIALVGFLLYLMTSFVQGFSSPIVRHFDVKINNLKTDVKVALIADLHIDKATTKESLQYIVESINKENPDIIALVGDILDTDPNFARPLAMELKNLKAKYGVYYVLGNHEYYVGLEESLQIMKDVGVSVLENTNQNVANIVNIAGVYDTGGHRFGNKTSDIPLAFKNIDKQIPTILLSHQPNIIYAIGRENVDLILSGHTHAGQIYPFNLLVKIAQPFVYGLEKVNDKTQIFVTSGVGQWGPALRVGTRKEIAILNLKQ